LNLILLEPGETSASGPLRISGPRAAHLIEVLKVAPGQTLRVGVLDGPRGTATVQSVSADAAFLLCALDAEPPPPSRVDLLLALPRPKVMRRLWAQLAALGVGRIILTNAERVERPYFDTHVLTPECYRPLLIEGLQQARDTILPAVSIHRRFKVLIEDELDGLSSTDIRLVADPATTTRVSEAVRSPLAPAQKGRVLLAIGPEGGWNAFELALLGAHGFRRVGMGPRTLRTDTACLALLALVHDTMTGEIRKD
jgi:16S rRNA (uracil1498-N3)-methyltransferase